MRFSVPRSLPPSPAPKSHPRRSSTFGLNQLDSSSDEDTASGSGSYSDPDSDSDSDSDADSAADSSSVVSSSSDSFCYASESEVPPPPPRPRRHAGTPAEQRYVADTIAAIRLRTRHRDPYEEWERQTRKDAFRTARREQSLIQSRLHDEQDRKRSEDAQRMASLHARQAAEVQAQLQAIQLQQQRDESRLKEVWKARERRLWERIEGVIKFEQDKVQARLDAERKVREEEERKRKAEELERRLAEEKLKEEAEKKKREAEEAERLAREKQEKEAEEERQRLEEERAKAEQSKAEEEERKKAGLTTAEEDWIEARTTLKRLKEGPMKNVKSNKQLKSTWSALRRQITPKVGQLTNDPQAIARISQQLYEIVRPSTPHPPDVYYALLSSLAKAILLQAETEVTAEKRSAVPLAQVTANLLDVLENFPQIFFAKLVQRAGGWPIPGVIPNADVDGRPWGDETARAKAMGYRNSNPGEEGEGAVEYSARVSGLMRVYFAILVAPVPRPLAPMFATQRCWVWVARILGERGLLETAVAPQIIYTALDVFGSDALEIWAQQWIKVLALLYEGVMDGIGGGRVIGGQSPEGKAARVRVQLEIERIMASVPTSG